MMGFQQSVVCVCVFFLIFSGHASTSSSLQEQGNLFQRASKLGLVCTFEQTNRSFDATKHNNCESVMSTLLEIRVGQPIDWKTIKSNHNPSWGENIDCAYVKHAVGPSINIYWRGPEGNMAGYPGHVTDTINRAVLVFNELSYNTLRDAFHDSASTLRRGGFGENFVVNHPDLLPSVVCIGDVYSIGSAMFRVSGPRAPCPKVDKWHKAEGMAKLAKSKGLAGYFLKVLKEGSVSVGDEITLLDRPRPGFTIERISSGLWGEEGTSQSPDYSQEFLEAVAGMEELIERHYRDTATSRLFALLNQVESDVSSGSATQSQATVHSSDAFFDLANTFWHPTRGPPLTVHDPWNHSEATVMRLPLWVRRWMYLGLGGPHLLGLVFIPLWLKHPTHYREVMWIYVAFLGHLMVSYLIYASSFTLTVGIVSCNHVVFWSPLVLYLYYQLLMTGLSCSFVDSLTTCYGLWLALVTSTITLSLYFDTRAALAYVAAKPKMK
jgi:MOSC domain-containing protein YiiM